MKALAGLILLALPCLGQAQTNLVTISNAVKIASGLHVGMPQADVHKYMQAHGMTQTNVCSISLDRGRTLTCPYPLAEAATLTLEMHCTQAPPGLFGWKNPVLDRANIQSGGSNIISIALTNAPNPASAVDARSAFCLHFEGHLPGASEGERCTCR
jgi:hypothetical protein